MFCTKCGAKLGEGARFCHRCGFRVPDAPPKTDMGTRDKTPEDWSIALRLFGEEDTEVPFDLPEHVKRFSADLPPLAGQPEAAEYVRTLRKEQDDPWTFDLPFTAAEAWSPAGYLRRLLYHLTQGRISYFLDAETKRKRGGTYSFAATSAAMQMNQQRFEIRHPITFHDESFLFEWPVARDTSLAGADGGLYFTQRRCLFAADRAWVSRDDEKTPPLPFLSYWNAVDFSTLLRALGEKGVRLWVETRRRYLPNRLAPRTWFEPLDVWQEKDNLKIISMTGWEMDLVFVEGHRQGDGVDRPGSDQNWVYFGSRVQRADGRKEFVALTPPFIVPAAKQVKKGIEAGFEYLRSQTETTDALDLIAFATAARDNELLHSADPVSWPVPLQEAPYQV